MPPPDSVSCIIFSNYTIEILYLLDSISFFDNKLHFFTLITLWVIMKKNGGDTFMMYKQLVNIKIIQIKVIDCVRNPQMLEK